MPFPKLGLISHSDISQLYIIIHNFTSQPDLNRAALKIVCKILKSANIFIDIPE